MRTTLDLPIELLEEARLALGFKSKTDTSAGPGMSGRRRPGTSGNDRENTTTAAGLGI